MDKVVCFLARRHTWLPIEEKKKKDPKIQHGRLRHSGFSHLSHLGFSRHQTSTLTYLEKLKELVASSVCVGVHACVRATVTCQR